MCRWPTRSHGPLESVTEEPPPSDRSQLQRHYERMPLLSTRPCGSDLQTHPSAAPSIGPALLRDVLATDGTEIGLPRDGEPDGALGITVRTVGASCGCVVGHCSLPRSPRGAASPVWPTPAPVLLPALTDSPRMSATGARAASRAGWSCERRSHRILAYARLQGTATTATTAIEYPWCSDGGAVPR